VLTAAYFEALRSSPLTTVPELTDGRPFVVVSPHPDDETLGAGGLIAEACDHNQAVDVIVVTDGSGSHPRSVIYPRQRLIDVRCAEVHAAGEALGLGSNRLSFLGLPDTLVPTSGAAFEAAVTAIHHVIQRSGAGSLFVTWAGDPHCDHEASAEMAKAVRKMSPGLKLWAYPIWGWHIDARAELPHPPPGAFRTNISKYRDRKRRAIDAHASQMTDLISDDPTGFRFNETSLAPFLGDFEYFIEVPT
jgi:LmbE family N-acetylglucosaminyl deacetylase